MRKKAVFLIAAVTICISSLFGCSTDKKQPESSGSVTDALSENTETESTGKVTITDSEGNQASLDSGARVVSLYASYAECYILAGGMPVGVTKDALDERDLGLPEDTGIVGTVKEPNVEAIISLDPDYVIMSADLTAHADIEDNLKNAGIQYGYYRVDTFEDYSYIMSQFCAVTGRDDLFEKNVTDIKNKIEKVKENAYSSENAPKVLLMRAFSTGVKAKGADNTAGIILRDLCCHNIADDDSSILEDLSIEKIIEEDPDYIFINTMGDEDAAISFLNDNMMNNPAWNGLKAVQNDNCHILPKELFHYKPNNRWAESYEYIADLLSGSGSN